MLKHSSCELNVTNLKLFLVYNFTLLFSTKDALIFDILSYSCILNNGECCNAMLYM